MNKYCTPRAQIYSIDQPTSRPNLTLVPRRNYMNDTDEFEAVYRPMINQRNRRKLSEPPIDTDFYEIDPAITEINRGMKYIQQQDLLAYGLELLSQLEYQEFKLKDLDPRSKYDAEKIAKTRFKIVQIGEELVELKNRGLVLPKRPQDSLWGRIMLKLSSIWNAITSFFKENGQMIGVAVIGITLIVTRGIVDALIVG